MATETTPPRPPPVHDAAMGLRVIPGGGRPRPPRATRPEGIYLRASIAQSPPARAGAPRLRALLKHAQPSTVTSLASFIERMPRKTGTALEQIVGVLESIESTRDAEDALWVLYAMWRDAHGADRQR